MIERTYDRQDVTTFGAFNIALARNTHDYFATSTSQTLAHTTTESALERAYSAEEATANHSRATTVAGLDENYRRLESAALAGEVSGFSGSPWTALNKAIVEADDDYRIVESSAAEALRIAVADADKLLETEAANTLETLTNELARIGANEVMTAADGEVNSAVSAAVRETVDFHAGVTNPANPEMPQLPSVYSHAIDAVIEEDYSHDDYYYEGSMYWGWHDGSQVNELRFFGLQPTNRSQLPHSFPDLYQVTVDLERGIAERREFELPYDLTMEGYFTDEALSSFEAIGRLGVSAHQRQGHSARGLRAVRD